MQPARVKIKIVVRLLAAILLTTSSFAEEQQPSKIVRIGVLRIDTSSSPSGSDSVRQLRQGMSELGYKEGENVAFEIRWAENNPDRLAPLAAELVRLKVDVIVTSGPQAVRATKEATSTIPIVMGRMDDVVEHGLVSSLARPGGNITGLSFQTGELSGKWLDLLKETLPILSRVATMWDETSTAGQLRTVEETARSLGLQLQVLKVRGPSDLSRGFEAAKSERAEGVIILASPILTGQRVRLAEMALKQRLPAIYYHEGFAFAGGLMAYGPKESDFNWRRATTFVDKILKGAKPADLPVEQPTKFEFMINLKTAKQIGLTIPQSVLYRADKVIK